MLTASGNRPLAIGYDVMGGMLELQGNKHVRVFSCNTQKYIETCFSCSSRLLLPPMAFMLNLRLYNGIQVRTHNFSPVQLYTAV